MHGRELSDSKLPKPDRLLFELSSTYMATTKAAKTEAVWEELQKMLPRFKEQQKVVFNTIVGAVQPGPTSNNMQLPISEE